MPHSTTGDFLVPFFGTQTALHPLPFIWSETKLTHWKNSYTKLRYTITLKLSTRSLSKWLDLTSIYLPGIGIWPEVDLTVLLILAGRKHPVPGIRILRHHFPHWIKRDWVGRRSVDANVTICRGNLTFFVHGHIRTYVYWLPTYKMALCHIWT